jgi:cardiolipin synthase
MRLLREAGVQARESLPFHFLRGRTRRDMRNHRKLFIIDGAIGYAGSQNIVAKDFRPGISNCELMVRVTGPVIAEMTAVFLADWYLETETMLDQAVEIPTSTGGTVTAQLLPSGADYPLEGFETLLVWQIHEARQRVLITTPYFIPDEDLLGAMRTAVLRGVEIDLIVSAIEDQRLVSLAQHSYYEDLLKAGIRIHRFRNYLLHAKSVTIDGTLAIIGSSNVDIRSFQLNEEVSLLLLNPEAVAQLESIQRSYLAASDAIDLEEWRGRSSFQKLGENMARLVSPLL